MYSFRILKLKFGLPNSICYIRTCICLLRCIFFFMCIVVFTYTTLIYSNISSLHKSIANFSTWVFNMSLQKVLENYQGVLISWLLKFLLYKHNSNLSHLTCTALLFSFAFPSCVFLLNHCVFLMVSWFWSWFPFSNLLKNF